jgi:hypothetical protein
MMEDLNNEQRVTMYLASAIRNAMESFHVKHLTDTQMAELNPIIRNAIYTALVAHLRFEDSDAAKEYVEFCLRCIPTYWEDPELIGRLAAT